MYTTEKPPSSTYLLQVSHHTPFISLHIQTISYNTYIQIRGSSEITLKSTLLKY